jgi:hypothetical protein
LDVQHVERVRSELLNEMKQSLLSLHRIIDDKLRLADRKTSDLKTVRRLVLTSSTSDLVVAAGDPKGTDLARAAREAVPCSFDRDCAV